MKKQTVKQKTYRIQFFLLLLDHGITFLAVLHYCDTYTITYRIAYMNMKEANINMNLHVFHVSMTLLLVLTSMLMLMSMLDAFYFFSLLLMLMLDLVYQTIIPWGSGLILIKL